VRFDRIAVGDIVKASIKPRVVYGEVRQIIDGVVHFRLSPRRRLVACERARDHRALPRGPAPHAGEDDDDASPRPAREQLSTPGVET
jgi:hypothetical protein